MPKFTQEQQQAPRPASDMLVGHGHRIVDLPMAESQALDRGQVVGVLSASEQVVALDTTRYETVASGDAATTTFTLGHDSVDAESVVAMVGGAPVYDFTISRGTGTAGEDEIVFGTAPASGTDNIVAHYQRTSARPAGVLYEAMTTEAGETPTAPVVIEGGVLLDHLMGVPDGYGRGMRLGGVVLH